MKTILPWLLIGALIGAIGYNLIYSWLNPSKDEYMYVGDLAHGFDWYADSLGDSVTVTVTATRWYAGSPDDSVMIEVVKYGANTDWKLKTAVDEPVSFSLDTVKRTIIPPIVLFKDRVLRLGGWEPLDTAKGTVRLDTVSLEEDWKNTVFHVIPRTLREYNVVATHRNFSIKMSLMAANLIPESVKILEVHYADTTRVEVYPEYITPISRSRWSRATFNKAAEKTGTAYRSKFHITGILGAGAGGAKTILPMGGITIGHEKIPLSLGAGFISDQWLGLITWRF